MQAFNEIVWSSCGRTHAGLVRRINEDAFAEIQNKSLWVVADGMGGHQKGDFASSKIVKTLKQFEAEKFFGSSIKKIFQQLNDVNDQLIDEASKHGNNQVIGSTVAILYASHNYCVIIWSGDSRIYFFRRGELKQLSRDHNNESQLLDEGVSPDEIQLHPYAQALTHAIGGEKEAYLDAQIQEVREGDIFLLCSDGLNKEVTDSEIEDVLGKLPYQDAVNHLMELALQRGGRDNISIIVLKVSKAKE